METMKSFDNRRDEALQYIRELRDAKIKFIRYNRDECGGNGRIIEFIADILFHGANGVSVENSVETIRNLFEAGYCYYFAKMLEDAFPGGTICLCYDFGHMVYVYEEIAYDIHGVSDAEAQYYVPIDMIGRTLNAFKHIPGEYDMYDPADLSKVLEWCETTGGVWAMSECNACKEAVKKCEAIVFHPDVVDEYYDIKVDFYKTLNDLSKQAKHDEITWKQYKEGMINYCHSKGLSWFLIKKLRGTQKI